MFRKQSSQNQRVTDMPTKFFPRFSGAAALVLGIALSPLPAHAGFEWVAPNTQPTYQAPSMVAPALPSQATTAPEIISPVIISGDSGPTMHTSPAETFSMAPAPVPVPKPAPSRTDLATATITMPSPANNGVVQGFASQIPLALALRQILPTGTNFSIEQDVNMDTSVSYKGGKPWRETLQDMLTPAGLVDHEQGSTVIIGHVSAPPPPVEATAPSPSTVVSAAPASFLPHMAETPSFTVHSADGWSADRGETLRKVLADWSRRSGTELQWLAEYDYPIEASAHFSGSYEDAVRNLLAGFENARPQPIGELHANPTAGQTVLVVQARGNSYSN